MAESISWANQLDTGYLNPNALEHAQELANKPVQLDANLAQAHAQRGWALCRRGEHDAAIGEFRRAIALNPNLCDWRFGSTLLYAGEPTRAIEALERHLRVDPFYPPLVPGWLGLAFYMLKRYVDALTPIRECISRAPNLRAGHMWMAMSYAQLNQMAEARAEAAEVLRIQPQWTINGFGRPVNRFRNPEDAEHFFEGLRKAGLPE